MGIRADDNNAYSRQFTGELEYENLQFRQKICGKPWQPIQKS